MTASMEKGVRAEGGRNDARVFDMDDLRDWHRLSL